MTEPLTPEARAQRLLEHLFDDYEGWPDWWEEDIAAAIAAAECDAIESSGSQLADADKKEDAP